MHRAPHSPNDAPAPAGGIGVMAQVHAGLFTLVFTGLIAWLNIQGLFPIRPALFSAVMVLLCLSFTLPRRPAFPLATLLMLALMFVHAVDAALQRWPDPEGWQSATFTLSNAFLLSLTAAAAAGRYIPGDRRPLLLTAALTIAVCTGANLAEFAGVFTYSTSEGRAAGFIGDANDSGIAIVCMTAVYLSLSRKFSHCAFILLLAATGVFPTLSRSGFLNFSLVVLTWAVLNFREYSTRLLLIFAVLITLVASAAGLLTSRSGGVNENMNNRISAIFGGDVDKMESTERKKVLLDGIEAAANSPVAGYGTGSGTMQWIPHNMFVSLWLDLGPLAAALYGGLLVLLLFTALFRGSPGLICAVPVIGFVPFSQMLLQTSCYMLCFFTGALLVCRHPLRFSLRRASPTTTASSNAHGLPA